MNAMTDLYHRCACASTRTMYLRVRGFGLPFDTALLKARDRVLHNRT